MSAIPFDLSDLSTWTRWCVCRLLDAPAFGRVMSDVRAAAGQPFATAALGALDVSSDVAPHDLARIPAVGPLVVVANHPHGALDGLLMADIVGRVRRDVRILANHVLARIPDLRDQCFFVDPFERANAAARSRAGLRAARLWLRQGGAIIAFPSGEVAHALVNGAPVDSKWKPTVLRLAADTGAQVVPAFIEGANRKLFYAAGRIHPALRTVLLGRELLGARGRRVTVRIGASVHGPASVDTVRTSVEALSDPVVAEIAGLSDANRLLSSGPFDVFCSAAAAIPATLREIGRLREITYRAIGEGTGRDCDTDRFDADYLHLFVWNRDARQVVGAYRLGRADEIVEAKGVTGLYTRSLFRYGERLLNRFGGPALELGRSFVRSEYQKNYSALLLLWRGIGEFVVRHPQYRFLFGPVSVSARYSDMSQRLLIEFLRQNHRDDDLAELVDPLHPMNSAAMAHTAVGSIDDVNRLVAGIEPDGKGVPVLLRQYLKLNARVLGFNIDPNFGDALDALMLVDLTRVDPAILKRYLGAVGAARFLHFHASSCAA